MKSLQMKENCSDDFFTGISVHAFLSFHPSQQIQQSDSKFWILTPKSVQHKEYCLQFRQCRITIAA